MVVDNAGDAQTASTVAHASKRGRFPVGYVVERTPGLLAARHRGVKETRGETLAFLDDDVILDPGWLNAVQAAFGDENVSIATGPSRPRFECSPPPWLSQFVDVDEDGSKCSWLSLLDLGPSAKRVSPRLVWGLNMGIRRATLYALGGFHPDYMPPRLWLLQGDGENGPMSVAARRGLRAMYLPGASVAHEVGIGRVQESYFCDRAASQAISDSYASIREEGVRGALSVTQHLLRVRARVGARVFGGSAFPGFRVRARAAAAYIGSYEAHQKTSEQFSPLRDWVRRPDYWDYSIPQSLTLISE